MNLRELWDETDDGRGVLHFLAAALIYVLLLVALFGVVLVTAAAMDMLP